MNTKLKKIPIIGGHVGIGPSLEAIIRTGFDPILIEPPGTGKTFEMEALIQNHIPVVCTHFVPKPSIITINEIDYEEIQTQDNFNKLPIIEMLSYGNTYNRFIENLNDLVEEFRSIQLKTSTRSKWEREEITHLFFKKYKQI